MPDTSSSFYGRSGNRAPALHNLFGWPGGVSPGSTGACVPFLHLFLILTLLLVPAAQSCTRPLPGTDFQGVAALLNVTAPLAVAGTSPADGAREVQQTHRPAVIFNRAMNTGTLTVQSANGVCSGTFQISPDNFTNCLGGVLSSSNNATTFVFQGVGSLAAGTTYRMRITSATDTQGDALTPPFTQANGFTTAANPAVVSVSPANATTNVNVNSTISFAFNKQVSAPSVFSLGSVGACSGATVQLSPFPAYTICLAGTVTTTDNQNYTLTPAVPFPEGVPLYLRLAGFIQDTSGTTLAANFDSTFTPYTPLNTNPGTLQVWLKAGAGTFTDAGTTAANNGDPVQQWNDQSGNNNHAVQLTGLNKPRLVTGVLNGQSVMRFDGVTAPNNDFLDLNTIMADPEAISFTVFFVQRNSGTGSQALLAQRNGTGFGRLLIEHKPANRHGSNLAGAGLGGNPYTDDSWVITSLVWNRVSAAAGTITMYADGALDAASATVDPEAADGIWRIGVSKNGTGTPFDGRIAEILIYSAALSGTDRRRVECYLGRKYNLTITGHTCN